MEHPSNASSGQPATTPTLTTVVDDHPRFCAEFVLWAICARRFTQMPRRAYLTFEPSAELRAFAVDAGCDLHRMQPLIDAAPHCNKLYPFLDRDGAKDQIVTDTDVFLVRDLQELFDTDRVRLPPNNHANPPLPVFQRLFDAVGIAHQPEPGLALFKGHRSRETYAGNVSAGVISIPERHRDFVQAWRDRAVWLDHHRDLLKAFAGHIDQISFALAAAETRVPFSFWPAQGNAILHLVPELETVYAFHLTSGHIPKFPEYFTEEKQLRIPGVRPTVENAIASLNESTHTGLDAMRGIPETRDFIDNFFNPEYKR